MVTLTDGFTGQNRISEQRFAAALESFADQDVMAELSGGGGYWKELGAAVPAVDPLFVLAIFDHESNGGRNGIATLTHSWGNMRNPPVGPVPFHTYHDQVKGDYLSFGSWLDGCLATAYHLDSPLYRGLSIQDAIHKWAPAGDGANDPDAYARGVVDFMNQWADQDTPGKATTVRIIVSAGHENIGNITAEKIGQASADALRGATGANGEREFNSAWADSLVALLSGAGVQAVRTDACWHPEVYEPDADLVIAGHYDGGAGSGHAQYCMAATVHSGPSTTETDTHADLAVQDWYAVYPVLTGIAGDGPVTVDMTEYYGGWYRTANTPMILIEHCLGADADGMRGDRPTPEGAAQADFQALDANFHFTGGKPQPPPAQTSWEQPGNPHPSVPLRAPFWNRWNFLEQTRAGLGLAMMGWALGPEIVWHGRRVQRFERGWFGAQETAGDPWNVVALFPEEWPK